MRLFAWLSAVLLVMSVQADMPPTKPTSSMPSSWSPALSKAEQAVISMYWVASEMTLKMKEKLLQPALQFWQEQEAAALERKWKAQQPQESSPTPRLESTMPETNLITSIQSKTIRTKKPKIAMILAPTRMGKVFIAAWVLAEGLDRLGILQEDTPEFLRSRFDRTLFHIETSLREIWHRFESGIGQTNKPPFAMGVAAGMIASPLVALAWKPFLAVLCLAEWNAHRRMHGKWHVASSVGDGLERLRYHVRSLLPQSNGDHSANILMIDARNRGLMEKGHGRTLLIKAGGSSEGRQKFWIWRARNETVPPIQAEIVRRDRFREVLRHGAFVGSLLGLLGIV